MQLFCDLDGVLADFDGHYKRVFGVDPRDSTTRINWRAMRDHKDFFAGISLLSDAHVIWSWIEHHHPVILTGIPNSIPEAAQNKKDWVAKYISPEVEVICCRSEDKWMHALEGDVLIDDREQYKHLWLDMGGVWITHRSAVETIKILDGMGL